MLWLRFFLPELDALLISLFSLISLLSSSLPALFKPY
jgi:hypothetical protein